MVIKSWLISFMVTKWMNYKHHIKQYQITQVIVGQGQSSPRCVYLHGEGWQINATLYRITEMSKKGGKEKKGENNQNLEAQVEEQKREMLQQSFTIKQLQDRISRMTEQNYQIVATQAQTQKKYEDKIHSQQICLESHESTIEKLNTRNQKLEILKMELESTISTLEKQVNHLEEVRTREMDEYKKLVGSEMGVLENQLKQYTTYMKERDELFAEKNKLRSELSSEKEEKERELADKEREKVQETDKLKDEMLLKIRDMRTNLLSLKKEQLSTTTRLAVLQNHQLTSELEYQSKQTEKLLFENESLIKKVSNMQKDVQIHKEIEEELAKRSHMSKGIIKKLTNKIAELEEELNKLRSSSAGLAESNKSPAKVESGNNRHQEMIATLSKALQEKDRAVVKANAQAQLAESENKILKTKIRQNDKKSYELSVLLLKYYEDMMEGKTDIKVNENEKEQFLLDIRGVKKKQASEWSSQEVKLVVVTLLNQLRHNISKQNLGIPSINRSQILVVNDEDSESRLPSISIPEHSLVRKDSRKFREVPTSLVPKLVGSNLREWGRTVHSNSVSNIARKFK